MSRLIGCFYTNLGLSISPGASLLLNLWPWFLYYFDKKACSEDMFDALNSDIVDVEMATEFVTNSNGSSGNIVPAMEGILRG